jgi:O-antigen ligase
MSYRVIENSTPSVLWFAVGLSLTTATQLRIEGLPLGVGELLLAGWAAFSCLVLLVRRRVTTSPVLRMLSSFWVVAGLSLAAGSVVALLWVYGPVNRNFFHDMVAFGFVVVVMTSFIAPPQLPARVERTAALVLPLTVIPLAAIFLSGATALSLGPLRLLPWYGIRFTGWSVNPNQLALALVLIPPLGLTLARRERSRSRRFWIRFVVVLSVPLAIASQSDALLLSWVVGAGFLAALGWFRLATSRRKGLWGVALAYVVLPLALLLGTAAFGSRLVETVELASSVTYNEGGQGSTRMALWRHGIQAMSASPVFGLGPGAHSGYAGPFLDEEAHNTLIDWGASTGVVGLLAYLALFGWSARRLVAGRQTLLLTGLIMLLGYSFFHYMLRQPVFWFYFLSISVIPELAAAAPGGEPESPRGQGAAPRAPGDPGGGELASLPLSA